MVKTCTSRILQRVLMVKTHRQKVLQQKPMVKTCTSRILQRVLMRKICKQMEKEQRQSERKRMQIRMGKNKGKKKYKSTRKSHEQRLNGQSCMALYWCLKLKQQYPKHC